MKCVAAWLGMALLSCGSKLVAQPSSHSNEPRIVIDARTVGPWSVSYRLRSPARALVFDRSPDASRAAAWIAPPAFELVADGRGELVRRRDGAAFDRVTLRVPAVYADLPKDYAPFAPFGDGGMLVHSGRFFACADACSGGAAWSVTLRAPTGRHVIVDGRIAPEAASWIDGDQGRNVYVGSAVPVATTDVLAVIDGTRPVAIRGRLDADLPRFMRFFADRLGALPTRPLLFASYDAAHRPGWGRQGGTLPGQVFTHFYGARWSVEMTRPDFAFDLAWHFAHEAAHLYQRQITTSEKGEAWVHEGAAEAFAALALRRLDPSFGPKIDERIAQRSAACAGARGERPLNAVIAAGDFAAAYSCGLMLSLAIHEAALATEPRSDGLFAVWRDFVGSARRGRTPSLADYARVVSRHAGACMGDEVIATRISSASGGDPCRRQANLVARRGRPTA